MSCMRLLRPVPSVLCIELDRKDRSANTIDREFCQELKQVWWIILFATSFTHMHSLSHVTLFLSIIYVYKFVCMQCLEQAFDITGREKHVVKVIVIRSAKEDSFVVGADIDLLSSLKTREGVCVCVCVCYVCVLCF